GGGHWLFDKHNALLLKPMGHLKRLFLIAPTLIHIYTDGYASYFPYGINDRFIRIQPQFYLQRSIPGCFSNFFLKNFFFVNADRKRSLRRPFSIISPDSEPRLAEHLT